MEMIRVAINRRAIRFITLGFLGFTKISEAQSISPHFFGVNAWMSDTIGDVNDCKSPPCIRKGELHKQWDKIHESGASVIRYGGISPDMNKPTMFQYIRMIDSIRAKGMEPLIQVPFWKKRYTAQQAADIVHYVNVVKGKHVKYWSIGNEPNSSYSYTTAAQVAAYFKTFASAMKNEDPDILIVGPEISGLKKTILDGLTNPDGPDDITGTDSAGRYYVDIISFHTYPMQDGTSTRALAIAKLTAPGSLLDYLNYLNIRMSSCNTAHGRTGETALKTAITETNVNYDNIPSDNLYGLGANSFFGGQFVAEFFGIGLKKGVDFINLWSVMEGGNSVMNDGGYLDGSTGNKKPLYYHFQMMAENFKGNSINCTTNQANVKSFACQYGQETTVMILNEDLTHNYNYTVRLDTNGVTGISPLKINVNAGITMEYNEVISNQSTLLLTFDSTGAFIKKIEYSLIDNAVANLPPTLITTDCNTPEGMNVSFITPATATLNWSSTGTPGYNVRYKTTTSSVWTTANDTNTSHNIAGLTGSTAYEFQVASRCSNTSSSLFSASTMFTTTTPICNPPSGLNETLIKPTTATLNWSTTSATSYNVRYKPTASSTWTTTNVTSVSKAITGLTASTAYEFQVSSVCSINSSSAYSASKTFTTSAQPVVVITSPANNFSQYTPANITINANASSGNGTITKVEFYKGTTKIGEDLTAPYSFIWMNVTTGNYALKAISTDNKGLTGTSQIVNISITTCSTPTITPAGPTTMCSGSVLLKANTGSGIIYQWKKDGNYISGATGSTYTATKTGDYQVKLIQGTCISWSSSIKVKIQSGLSASITPGGPTTFCSGGNVKLYANTCSGYTYQWKKNNADISGATGATYTANSSGNYQVKITKASSKVWSHLLAVTVNSCRGSEDTLSYEENSSLIISEPSDSSENFQMKVFPNPNNGLFTIVVSMPALKEEKVNIKIVNMLGQEVYNKKFVANSDYFKETVELDNSLKTGVYTLQLMIGNKMENTNIILSK